MFQDAARFDPHDDEAIVAACLCCHACLRVPSSVDLMDVDDGPLAIAFCDRCTAATETRLSGGQFLRLCALPPLAMRVRLVT